MIDRPSYKTWHVWTSESTPVRHDDVQLDVGESVGIVVGGRRLVISVDDYGKVRTKVQKRVSVWADIED